MLSRTAALYDVRPLRFIHSLNAPRVAGGALLVLLAGLLVGCGVTTGGTGGVAGSATVTPTGKAAVKACASVAGDASVPDGEVDVGTPALVLTLRDANHESTAHAGQVIQVQLPATQRWSLARDDDGILELLQPAGYWDVKASVCIWNFRAVKAGSTTVGFAGRAICEPGQMCPAYVVAEEFPLTVA